MRRNKIFAALLWVLLPAAAGAQDGMTRVLGDIAAHSTALDVLARSRDAARAANRTGLTLAAPELGFDYLFGSPADMGHKRNYKVAQNFDIPTLSGAKRRAADGQDSVAATQYDVARTALLLEAKKQCIEVIYQNQLLALLARRQQTVARLAALAEERAERGDGTALDLNNARLSLAAIEVDRAEGEATRATLLADLKRLNAGRDVDLPDTLYGTPDVPADFAAWYAGVEARWPQLRAAEATVGAAERSRRLARQENLPELSVGYMQETTSAEAWRGLTFGVTLPLWSNRGKRRKAEADVALAQAQLRDARTQLRATLEAGYAKTVALARSADRMGRAVAGSNNLPLLAKALRLGQVSQIDYLQEVDRYYELAARELQMRRDAELAKAELTAADL